MLTEISLQNVRCFGKAENKLSLSPLTVFCGTNGSGKSTAIKSILLMRQSISRSDAGNARSGKLKFVGESVDLGSFESFINKNNIKEDIAIGLSTVVYKGKIDNNAFKKIHGIELENEDENYSEIKANFVYSSFFDTKSYKKYKKNGLSSRKINHCISGGRLKFAEFVYSVNEREVLKWHIKVNSIDFIDNEHVFDYEIHIPASYFERVGGNRMMVVSAADEKGYISAKVVMGGVFLVQIEAALRSGNKKRGGQYTFFPLPPVITRETDNLILSLKESYYLGPLRAPAKRYYLLNEEDFVLDNSGELLPYILSRKEGSLVRNCLPNKSWECQDMSLKSALNFWLLYLREGVYCDDKESNEYNISQTNNVLVDLFIASSVANELYSIADSGFGYSQVIPILVSCLVAGPGSTILVEQPELHLNPSLQVRLAEFFVSMAMSGRQLIIETHSEHIVNMIRVLSAEYADSGINDIATVYYLSKSGDNANVLQLSVEKNGMIKDMPREFFGEALNLSGRLLRAQRSINSKEQK